MLRNNEVVTEILVIIVNYRTASLAEACLEAIARERAAGTSLTAILVDGCSGDGSVAQLSSFLDRTGMGSWVELLPLDINGGFGWANNQAIQHRADCLPPYIYLVNPDARVKPGAISALAHTLGLHGNVAAVGSQLIDADDARTASAFSFPSIASEFVRGAHTSAFEKILGLNPVVIDREDAGEVDWVTGASVMLRTEALVSAGLFDDGFFLYFEEVELMHRLKRRGYKIWFEPRSRVHHIGGAATGVDQPNIRRARPNYWFQSRQRFFALTGGRAYGFMANLAWLFGHFLIGIPRRLLSSSFRLRAQPGELRGLLDTGLWPQGTATTPAAAVISGEPSQKPFWIEQA